MAPCDRFLAIVAILALAHAGTALAGDAVGGDRLEFESRPIVRLAAPAPSLPAFAASSPGALPAPPYGKRSLSDAMLPAPGGYGLGDTPEVPAFPAKDFRPHGRSVFDVDPRSAGAEETLSFNKNPLQRLNEYRTRDRVRVLTLWESGMSAISIQTDRRGGPSLQWTSSLMNRGGASHGVLDQLFPTSLFGGTTHITRSPSAQPSRITGALSALHLGNPPPPP